MATATEPRHAEADGYVDFDEFIDYQLTKTRSGIKANDLLTALIAAAAAVLAYVLVFALFDHWIVDGGFGQKTRLILLSLLAVGLAGWCLWKLVVPYFHSVSALYAARQIEQTRPDLENTLLTLVDLKRSGRVIPESIGSALEKRTALNLSHMDVDQAVDRRLLMRLSYVLFALVVLTCGYVIFSPKKLSNSLWRALLPTSQVAVATRTQIDNVEPGDVEVLARAQLPVTADLSGEVPADVLLLFTTADRRFVDEPVTMRESDNGLRRFSGVITGENGAGILQNLTYRVVAGDAESPAYAVTVKQPPSATVSEVRYEYPDYMGLAPRTQPGGAIDSWEGAWVSVRANANMPVKAAMVMFSDTEEISRKAEEIPAAVQNQTEITARWRLRIRSDGTYAGFYRIQCRNAAGETDADPTLYSIKIRPDLPPQIELAQPSGDLERPANAIIPLLYAAQDPDFALRSVVLHLELNGEALPQEPRLYQAPPFRQSLHDVHNLELEPLGLNPGDRLTYWLEARDNMEPFADRSGNRTNTPRLNITVTEPASPEEVQKQLEEEQQQIAEKLEEARHEKNDAQNPSPDGREQTGDDTQPPPPNSDQSAEPGSEPPDDQADDGAQQNGDGGAGQQVQQQPGAEQSGSGQQQGRPQGARGEQTSPDGQPQPGQRRDGKAGDEDGSSQPQPGGEESFDNLLERLMQREQQRQQEAGGQQPQQPDGQQQQPEPGGQSQQPQAGEQSQPGQSGETSPNAQQGNRAGPTENSGRSGEVPSQGAQDASQPGEQSGSPPSSTGNQSSGTSQSMNRPSTGPAADATSPSPGESPLSADQTDASGAEKGEPTASDAAPSGTPPSKDVPSQGGQKQPGDDATGAQPGGDGGTEAPPKAGRPGSTPPTGGQPPPQAGEPLQNPGAKSGGQPDGPDEPLAGEGDPQGQKSDRPQTGEGGNTQQTSQGNRGSDQQGAGDPTGRTGDQQTGQEKTGEAGGGQSSEGSQQKPGGAKPGSESASPDGKQPGSSQGGSRSSQPQDQQSTTPAGDGRKDAPEPQTSDNSPQGSEGQPAGQSDGKGQQPAGAGKDQSSNGQSSEGQPDGGEQGQASGEGQQSPAGKSPAQGGQGQGGQAQGGQGEGQASEGGQAGSPPQGGTPSGTGGGTRSDGGRDMDAATPDAGGGPGDGDAADANAGESATPNIQPEDPDLAAKKKAANLVLERLQEQLQRGAMDRELQQELGVTDEQLRDFTDRLQQRLAETSGDDLSPEAQARRRQFEETLRTIDYGSKGATREGGDGPRAASGGFAGPNRPAPPQHRDAARLYRERLLKKPPASR